MSSTTLLRPAATPVETATSVLDLDGSRFVNDEGTESYGHPLGVRPSGNSITHDNSQPNCHQFMGLFGRLPDSLLSILLEFLDQSSLLNIGKTCRGLYAFSTNDQLWREMAISNMSTNFDWRGSWRASLLRLPSPKLAEVDCRYLFSDSLHRPYLCSQLPLQKYVLNIPPVNEISRLDDMSPEEFNKSWVDKPFILKNPVKTWKIYSTWDEDELVAKYTQTPFRCEAVDWPLQTYIGYMRNTQDESPLYLFDRGFVEKMGLHENSAPKAYEIPLPFQEDYFMLLKDQRPDHRWLIVGPSRSGSTFHKDPNATSAWNAIIRGAKYWIMFPPGTLPPGVFISDDASEVTSPLSIAEWLLTFHAEARNTPGCIEGICRQGEVLHVPSGWWHLVVNLQPSIAITQNFIPKAHLNSAIRFLKDKPDQISGFKDDVKDVYGLFMERLREAHPELAASLEDSNAKKRKWEELVDNADGERQGFSFGFGADLDEDDIE